MAEDRCHALLEQLSAYVDGDLEEALCRALEAHLAGCEDCRIVVNTLKNTVELYRELPDTPLPEESSARLFRVLDLDLPSAWRTHRPRA